MEKNKSSIWMDLEDLTNQIDEAKSLLIALALSVQVPGLDTDNEDVSNVAYVTHRILAQVSDSMASLIDAERKRVATLKGGVAA